MTPLELAFILVVSNMQLPATCGHIPLPQLQYIDLSRYGERARGMYPKQGQIVYLDNSVCDDRHYLQHEIAHYVQWRCGLPQDEAQATEMQYLEE